MTKQERTKWIRNEVEVAYGEGRRYCPPVGPCFSCPYDVFNDMGLRWTCTDFPERSEEHKTAACFLAAIYEVEL
jgi:hypothetical protein